MPRLQISPEHILAFALCNGSAVAAVITLVNRDSKPVAFKLKTTSPSSYFFEPSKGVLAAGGTALVRVTLQRLLSESQLDKDKFLVQSTALPPGQLRLTAELFDRSENPDIHAHKLRVRVVS